MRRWYHSCRWVRWLLLGGLLASGALYLEGATRFEPAADISAAATRAVRTPAEDLNEETTEHLKQTALAAYQALQLRDYGRIDLRLTNDGKIYVIEANPNPWLSSGVEFAMAARKSGRTYADTMQDIVDAAMARYET